VYLLLGGMKVDLIGMQPESDYLAALTAEHSKPGDLAEIEPIDCSGHELFTPVPDEGETGLQNIWKLYLDREFVEVCRARARRVIVQNPERFGVSRKSA